MQLSRETINRLPKAELHCHLDGSLRISTMLDLAEKQKRKLPADNAGDLSRILVVDGKVKNLEEYLNLGNIPLVNSYVDPKNLEPVDTKYPLEINYCQDCSLSQLSIVVRPEIMYKNYFYRSSISKTFSPP